MPQRFDEEETTAEEVVYAEYAEDVAQPVYGPSTVIAALDQIDVLVENARGVPLSANIVLNKAEILDLVGQAREALPEDLVAADAVVADADAVLTRADSAAEAAVSEANAKARSVLEESRERADSIMAEARDEAERRVQRAEEESAHTISRAKKEAEDLLADARAQAERMVAADAVTEMAQSRANDLITKSRRESERLREGAQQYVGEALGQTSNLLNDLLRRTDAGLRAISDRRNGVETDIDIDRD